MPELINLTPFPNFRYYSRDNQDREFGIVIVKATYELDASGRLVQAEEQAPFMFTDKCHGEVNVTSLWHPSDLVPHKPATDVIINAVARAPDGKPAKDWICGITIADGGQELLSKKLRVTGPRSWIPEWRRSLSENQKEHWRDYRKHFGGWKLSDPEPITELPLHYEYTYGGVIEAGLDEEGKTRFETDHHNPLGRGKISEEWTDHTKPVPAPQIEAVDDPIADPLKAYKPQSFGPIPPAWLPRRPLGGTYDQNWIDNVWPAWPADYSFAYHNSAHPDLAVKVHLKGRERIGLQGLCAGHETFEIALPGEELFVDFVRPDETVERLPMTLDTVLLDIAERRTRDWRVFISWRVNFEPDLFERAMIWKKISTPDLEPALKEEVA